MIRNFSFNDSKYGYKLLMDLHRFESNPDLDMESAIHTIDFFEIMFFEYAEGSVEINGFKSKVGPGSILFASPFQNKRLFIDESSLKGFHLVFQHDFLANFFADKLFVYRLQYFYALQQAPLFKISQAAYRPIQTVLQEIHLEIKDYQTDSEHIIRSLVYFTLAKLNRLYANYYDLSAETQFNVGAYEFKAAVEAHFQRYHQVSDYARLLKMDRNKLNEVVKKQFQITARQLIQLRLIQEIKSMLLYSEKTILEIADDLNFSEANNLTRFFNRQVGLTPSQFRKEANR